MSRNIENVELDVGRMDINDGVNIPVGGKINIPGKGSIGLVRPVQVWPESQEQAETGELEAVNNAQEDIIEETQERLSNHEMQLTSSNLEKIGISRSEALRLAKETLGVEDPFVFEDFKQAIQNYQEEHNISKDGILGKETYIEMKAGTVLEKFRNDSFKQGISSQDQIEILSVLNKNTNISGLNFVGTPEDKGLLAFLSEFRSTPTGNETNDYSIFFEKLDSFFDKTEDSEVLENVDPKQNIPTGASKTFFGSMIPVFEGKEDWGSWFDKNKGGLKSMGMLFLTLSLIFGIPKEMYRQIPGGEKWYTRIPLTLGFLFLGGGELLSHASDKVTDTFSSGFSNTPEQTRVRSNAINNITTNLGSSSANLGSNSIDSGRVLENASSSISDMDLDRGSEALGRDKISVLTSVFSSNTILFGKYIDSIDDITTINALLLNDTEKRALQNAGITDEDIPKFIQYLVNNKGDGRSTVSDVILSLSGTETNVQDANISQNQISLGEQAPVLPQDNNIPNTLDTTTPDIDVEDDSILEQITQSPENVSDSQLINGLSFRLENFKIIAQKTEDLENMLGIVWNKKDTIEHYSKELESQYEDILIIISELRIREQNNPELSSKLRETYIFLAEYYSGGVGELDNDHLRNYNLSSIMALGILQDIDGCPKFPDLNDPNFEKEIKKFDIDLEHFIEINSNSRDPLVKRAISILKDNRGIGFFDFEEETTDNILQNVGGGVTMVGATAATIFFAPGVLVGGAIIGGGAVAGTTLNTIARGESNGIGEFAGETAILGLQGGAAKGINMLSKFMLKRNTSRLTALGVVGTEMAGDVAVIGMGGEALRAMLFEHDYDLGASFVNNLAWAPLALIGGVGSISASMRRTKLKQAIGDKDGVLEEIKFFNIEMSKFKKHFVGKDIEVEVDGKTYNVSINDNGAITTKFNGQQVNIKDEKIIEALAVKMDERLFIASNPAISSIPRLSASFKNVDFKRGFNSSLDKLKAAKLWVDGKLHYANLGSYLEKLPFIGPHLKKNPNFYKGVSGGIAFLLSDDEIVNIASSIADENKDLLSMDNLVNIGAIAGNIYGMYKLGIISMAGLHTALEKLGIKEDGFIDQIV